MCTVSWLSGEQGYELFFNRDEKRERGRALSPAVHCKGGVAYIAPTDIDGGGTWIAVNQHAVSICLLNGYHDRSSQEAVESRGWIPEALADVRSITEAAGRIDELSLDRFAPFRLLILEPGKRPWTCLWNGTVLSKRRDALMLMPLTSSSYQGKDVAAARKAVFRRRLRQGLTVETLYGFHRSHEGISGAYCVCMHRDDAQTVSYSRVRVDPESVVFRYTPGAPCECLAPESIRLERASLGPLLAVAS
jgi:hypothetical protein